MFLARRATDITRRNIPAPFVTDLDAPLLKLSAHPQDNFRLKDACAGVHAFGQSGGGKTSGLLKMLAGAELRAGFGGLVTCIKPESITEWKGYLAQHNRSKSLILFDKNEGINFLDYPLARHGMDGIGTVVETLMHVLEAAKRASSQVSQRGGDDFWEGSARMTLRATILPLYAAKGSVSVADIINFISSAPASLKDPRNSNWQERNFMYAVMNAAARRPKIPMRPEALLDNVRFWEERFPAIPEKTRGNIVITVTTVLDRFMHGWLQRAFCGKTTIVPELTFHGAVILLALPTLVDGADAVIGQQLFKFLWQKAVLSRNSLEEKHRARPVFLFSDEAQETVSSYDGDFLGLCRGSKCCVTYLTQSLPAYYAKIGGDNPRDAATNLVGKFTTHIYLANACPDTNDYAARVIGKVLTRRRNYSVGTGQSYSSGMSQGNSENSGTSHNHGSSYSSSSGAGGHSSSTSHNSGAGSNSGSSSNWGVNQSRGTSSNVSRGYTESMEYAIEPGDFARILKTGGRDNNNLVTGVWFQSGRIFERSRTNFLLETFKQ